MYQSENGEADERLYSNLSGTNSIMIENRKPK